MGVPRGVLRAFGVELLAVPLAGGQGEAFRAGDLVFKPVSNAEEMEWASELLSALEGPGFRVPKPVRAGDGRWVADGWAASRFIEGQHGGPNGGHWAETIAACEAFHAALRDAARPAFLDTRMDAWSVADRMAWGEQPIEALPEFAEPVERLAKLLRPVELPSQVVHGDFTANVLFADGQAPGVIDFSPYWRPAGFAVGVIVVDALTWGGADASIFELTAHIPSFAQLLVRAELRRVLELDQHTRRGLAGRAAEVPPHLRTIALIEQRATT
jgi:uncharacterized protein (TIGR02569 family)